MGILRRSGRAYPYKRQRAFRTGLDAQSARLASLGIDEQCLLPPMRNALDSPFEAEAAPFPLGKRAHREYGHRAHTNTVPAALAGIAVHDGTEDSRLLPAEALGLWRRIGFFAYIHGRVIVTFFVDTSSVMKARTEEADGRRNQILEAAAGVFLRYGYARTTMNDIAAAVGCSRTLIYVSFANKEAVFEAMVLRASSQAFEAIREVLPSIPALEARLIFVCEEWMAKRYDLLKVYPDAQDQFDLSFSAVRRMYLEFEGLLVELLDEAESSASLYCTTHELARCISYALRGFKEMADGSDELRRLIRLQAGLVASVFGRRAHGRTNRTKAAAR